MESYAPQKSLSEQSEGDFSYFISQIITICLWGLFCFRNVFEKLKP